MYNSPCWFTVITHTLYISFSCQKSDINYIYQWLVWYMHAYFQLVFIFVTDWLNLTMYSIIRESFTKFVSQDVPHRTRVPCLVKHILKQNKLIHYLFLSFFGNKNQNTSHIHTVLSTCSRLEVLKYCKLLKTYLSIIYMYSTCTRMCMTHPIQIA